MSANRTRYLLPLIAVLLVGCIDEARQPITTMVDVVEGLDLDTTVRNDLAAPPDVGPGDVLDDGGDAARDTDTGDVIADGDSVDILDDTGLKVREIVDTADTDARRDVDVKVIEDVATTEVVEVVEPACTSAADCPLPPACVTAACIEGGCFYPTADAGSPCQSAGTPSDTCEGATYHPPDVCDGLGACVDGGTLACEADGPCVNAICAPGLGCGVQPAGAGIPCQGEDEWNGGCEGATWHAPDRCDGAGSCVEGASTDCAAVVDEVCQLGICAAGSGCETAFAEAGTHCTTDDDGPNGVCLNDTWFGHNTCDGEGDCQDGTNSECPDQPCLSMCWDDVDPAVVGCADGSREGFTDQAAYPGIASCGGAWSVPGVFHEDPVCGREAGNTGENSEGVGCNVQDLCADGWSICDGRARIATQTGPDGCTDAVAADYPNFGTGTYGDDPAGNPISVVPGGAFFVAAVTGTGSGHCADNNDVYDDAFGCGNMGRPAPVGSCAPLDRHAGNLCRGLQDYIWPGGTDRDNPATDFGYDTPLDWAWWCDGSTLNEPNTIIKGRPDRQGGVLCCVDE